MAIEGLPTIDDLKDIKTNADVFNEVITSDQDETINVATDGETKKTLTGLENEFDASRQEFVNQGQATIDQFEADGQQSLDNFDAEQLAALANVGYSVAGNFTDGVAQLNNRSEAVYYAGDPLNNNRYNGFYVWTGSFPHTVTAGSSPEGNLSWAYAAGGYTRETDAILFMGKEVNNDISIPTHSNGISYKPEIAAGVTVTVPPGTDWKIIGETE